MGATNKFDPTTDIPDLEGKVFVVTGGSAGIGYGICAHLLEHNCAALYLLSQKDEHLDEAQEGLTSYGDVSRVKLVQIQLEDLKQTDEVARRLASELPRLDGLILNAGHGVGVYAESKDGIDTHMQVNVIAQWQLAKRLMPTLRKTADSRLVLQSSELHRMFTSSPNFESLEELNRDIGATPLYSRTKLAQVLLVRFLYRLKSQPENNLGLVAGQPPWINATHPGAIKTDQQDQAVEAYGVLGKIGVAAVRPFMGSPMEDGCRSALFAATGLEVGTKPIDGEYIIPDCQVSEVSKEGKDDQLGDQLWRLMEDILKEKLGS